MAAIRFRPGAGAFLAGVPNRGSKPIRQNKDDSNTTSNSMRVNALSSATAAGGGPVRQPFAQERLQFRGKLFSS